MADIFPNVGQAYECFYKKQDGCRLTDLAPVFWIQVALASLSAIFLFYTAENILGNRLISFTTFALILMFGELQYYASWLLTETVYYLFFFIFSYFSSAFLFRGGGSKSIFGAGCALAFAALTRPTYLYLYYVMILALPVYLWAARGAIQGAIQGAAQGAAIRKVLTVTGAMILPFVLIVLPWMLRNFEYYGAFNVSTGYASYILSERVACNLMSWREFLVSWIYWLPDFGDNLAADLFPAEYWQRLDFDHPDGFYRLGGSEIRDMVYAMAPTDQARVSFLFKDFILAEPLQHVLVTFALAWRGMLISKYFSLLGVLTLGPAIVYLKGRVEIRKILAFAFPFFLAFGRNMLIGFVFEENLESPFNLDVAPCPIPPLEIL